MIECSNCGTLHTKKQCPCCKSDTGKVFKDEDELSLDIIMKKNKNEDLGFIDSEYQPKIKVNYFQQQFNKD